MQQLRFELAKAKELKDKAKGPAKDALDGVIIALNWAIEGGGSPADQAANIRPEPAPEPKAAPKKAPAKKAKKK